jgi:hypothetical protein
MISDMKLRENFLTVCGGCDGTGEFEEPIGGFENSVTYKLTKCNCENGKEFDWGKLYKEIKNTKLKIEINQMSVDNHNQFMRDAMRNKDESRAIASLELLIKHENKATELETYLAELEEL